MRTDQELRELAAAGGICEVCGGVHVRTIDHAILASIANLPFCDCPACPVCEALRAVVSRYARLSDDSRHA